MHFMLYKSNTYWSTSMIATVLLIWSPLAMQRVSIADISSFEVKIKMKAFYM